MKAEEKKRIIILIGVAILAIIIILIVTGNKREQNAPNDKINTGDVIDIKTDDKTYSELEFTDINLKEKNGLAVFSATVKNNSANNSKAQWVTINVLDKNRNVIASIPGIVEEIAAGGTTTIKASMGENCENAYDVEIVSPNKES